MNSINVKLNNRTNAKGALQCFINEAEKYKPLTAEQEKTATPEQLVKHNMLFAISVAKRHLCDGVDLMDLLSEALIGLQAAAQKFKPEKGFKFISYAVFEMRQRITRFIDIHKDNVRYPELISRARFRIDKHGLHELETDEIAEKLKLSKYYVETAMSMKTQVSLDSKYEDGEDVWKVSGYFFADENVIKNSNLKMMLRNLNETELLIIRDRYLTDYQLRLDAIAVKLGICRERVRQIEKIALNKIKRNYEKILRHEHAN